MNVLVVVNNKDSRKNENSYKNKDFSDGMVANKGVDTGKSLERFMSLVVLMEVIEVVLAMAMLGTGNMNAKGL